MKAFFVFFFATATISLTLADLDSDPRPVWKIQGEQNATFISPSRIIQGAPATYGLFPYQVHLTIYSVTALIGYCGGSIIHYNWVLTAAHCAATRPLLDIQLINIAFRLRAGSLTVSGTAEQARTVLFIDTHVHPGYNDNTLMNDVAVLKTQTAFTPATNVAPIALVAANTDKASYVGQFVTVSGFGYISNSGPVSNTLLYTDALQCIPFATCQSQFLAIPTTSFCIQDPTPPISAICSGDSGGPVTLGTGEQKRQIGIVSYGAASGCTNAAQGQTNVAEFVPWILQITGPL